MITIQLCVCVFFFFKTSSYWWITYIRNQISVSMPLYKMDTWMRYYVNCNLRERISTRISLSQLSPPFLFPLLSVALRMFYVQGEKCSSLNNFCSFGSSRCCSVGRIRVSAQKYGMLLQGCLVEAWISIHVDMVNCITLAYFSRNFAFHEFSTSYASFLPTPAAYNSLQTHAAIF